MAQAGQRFQRIRRRHKLLGMLRLFRLPNLLLIFLGQVLVIWKFPVSSESLDLFRQAPVWFLLLATQAAAAAGYILNDYHDVKIDSVNKPGRVVVGRLVTRRKALFAYGILNISALLFGFAAGRLPGLLVFLCCFFLWLYSARLKCVPLAGNLVVALLVAVSIFLPSVLFRADNQLLFYFCQFAFFSNLIRELVKDLEDMRGDAQHACRTFPIAFGIPASRRIINTCGALLLCGLIGLLPNHPFAGGFLLLMVSLPFGYFFFHLQKADKKLDFHRLSRILKWAMLAGMLGMLAV